MKQLTPRQIVAELDRHIIGQADAKRAVAIALRNRWRRQQVKGSIRNEITPKNIMLIGPTGVGKTEIARRLAHLAEAPFVKVEATKYTEVGYVGRDVETMIRDLLDASIQIVRKEQLSKLEEAAQTSAEEHILDLLLPPPASPSDSYARSREKMQAKLRSGILANKEVDIAIPQKSSTSMHIGAIPGQEEMGQQIQDMLERMNPKPSKTKRMTVAESYPILKQIEAERLLDEDKIIEEAIDRCENTGIVFLDEIDKISHREGQSGDVSREGVQRDLLPLVEGCCINTRHGSIKTDHILFIASGAFHVAKPSDLIPELQGRFPIRVHLHALSEDDFRQILTQPEGALTRQYIALMQTEGVAISFADDAVAELARMAVEVNHQQENIGARRLHTLLECCLEQLSFEASDMNGASVCIDKAFVESKLGALSSDTDLSRYIL